MSTYEDLIDMVDGLCVYPTDAALRREIGEKGPALTAGGLSILLAEADRVCQQARADSTAIPRLLAGATLAERIDESSGGYRIAYESTKSHPTADSGAAGMLFQKEAHCGSDRLVQTANQAVIRQERGKLLNDALEAVFRIFGDILGKGILPRLRTYDEVVNAAHELAVEINAELYDAHRRAECLNRQAIEQQARIAELEALLPKQPDNAIADTLRMLDGSTIDVTIGGRK